MTIYLEKVNSRWYGTCYQISTEYGDPYIYPNTITAKEAIAAYEKDRRCKVEKAFELVRGAYKEVKI